MLFTPEQFLLLGVVLLGGLLIGYACAPSPRKYKRRVREQSESFTEHYAALEEQLRTAKEHAAALETRVNALRADHADAERTIGTLRAAAMAAPVAVVAAEDAHRPAPASAEPEPEPIADAEWTPVASEPPHAPAEVQPRTEPVAEIAHHEHAFETATPLASTHAAEEVSDETPKGAPAPGDTFPDPKNADAPREDPATLSTDSAPAAEALNQEPVAQAPMTPVPTDAPPAPIGPAEPEMPSKGWFASSARDDLTRIRGIDGVLNTRLFSLGVVRFEDIEKLSAEDEMALEQRLALPVGYIAREQWRTQSALLRAGQTEEHAAHFAAEPVLVG